MISELMIQQAMERNQDRLLRLATAFRAYEGDMPPQLASSKSDKFARDNVLINYAQPIVDKGVSFLMGKEVEFEVDGETETPAEEWLEACWAENKKMTLLHKAAINGGVAGDVFLRLTLALPGKQYPRIVNLDPANVTPILDEDDHEIVLAYVIQWQVDNPVTKTPMLRRQVIEQTGVTWRMTTYESIGSSKVWTQTAVQNWPYAWCPIHHGQNLPCPNTFWGMSDIEAHVLEINNKINFTLSNTARIIRAHAHPKTVAKGIGNADIRLGVDDVLLLPGENSEIKNLEMQSDLSSTLEFYKRLKELLHEVTRVPEVATGKVDNIGALSGVALKILYQSLLEKNDTKHLTYGDLLEELNLHLLEMGKQGTKHTIVIQWQDPLPKDDLNEANASLLLNELGVSKDTLLTNLGFDAQDELDKSGAEAQTAAKLGIDMMGKYDKGQLAGQNAPSPASNVPPEQGDDKSQ